MRDLAELAKLFQHRNAVDAQISAIIERPALTGHVGEYIACAIFDIVPHASATDKGSDGVFKQPALMNKRVNIKFYPKRENLLDVNTTDSPPDYYLVLAGPKSAAASSKGATRPWTIASVHLFAHDRILRLLRSKELHIGVASSVSGQHWRDAEIYPASQPGLLPVSEAQRKSLALFAG